MIRGLNISIFIIASTLASAQNLVQNSSFENYTNCPTTLSELNYAYPWESPSFGTPDFYHDCAGPCDFGYLDPVCVPKNVKGYQQARTGSGHAGIYVYDNNDYREYIQSPLSSTLISGQVYEIGFYISLPDVHYICATEFGMAFQNISIFQNNNLPLQNITPNLQTPQLYSDTTNWIHITTDYTANGSENYVIIGNFVDNANTVTSSSCGNYNSYYFIDDVYVIPKSASGINTYDNLTLNLHPNPASDKLVIKGLPNETFIFSIFDSFGKVYKSGEVSQNNNSIDVSDLYQGIFFIEFSNNQSKYTKKFIKN